MDTSGDRPTAAAIFTLILVSLLLASVPAFAQEWPIRFDGRVQWVAGQQMVVNSDFGPSITVDLLRVPQGEYAGLTAGDRVTIIGVVRNGNPRVRGSSVVRTETQAP